MTTTTTAVATPTQAAAAIPKAGFDLLPLALTLALALIARPLIDRRVEDAPPARWAG